VASRSKAEARELFLERFVPKVKFTGYCWLWTAATVGAGPDNMYPALQWNGKIRRAHRLAYLYWNGPIPKGKEVHHTCGVKLCVNPDHLELRTSLTHHDEHRPKYCVQGHKLTPDNRRDSGACRTCARLRAREAYRRKQARRR